MFKICCHKVIPSLKNMQTYCLSCRKHTDNIGSKEVTVTNKVIREKSRCANCVAEKSRFLKQNSNKKSNKK